MAPQIARTFRITVKRAATKSAHLTSITDQQNAELVRVLSILAESFNGDAYSDRGTRFNILHQIYIRYFFRHKPIAISKFLELNEFDRLVFIDKVKCIRPEVTQKLGDNFII